MDYGKDGRMPPKRHHYVPEFYLSYFLPQGGKTFWVYDKQGGGEPRPQQPNGTAVITYYYTFETSSGQQENLETEFSQLEGLAKPVLDRWQEPKAVPEVQEIEVMAAFLAFLFTRGPRAVRMTTELEIATLVELFQQAARNPAEMKKMWERFVETPGKADTFSLEQFQAFLENPLKDFEFVENNPKYPLSRSLLMTENILPYLLDRNWCLCIAPSHAFFVTSDTPISVFAPSRNLAWAYGGFGLKDAKVAFPVSPGVCLLLSHQHTQKRWSVSESFVGKMNMTTVSLAERFVVAPLDTKRIRDLITKSPIPPKTTEADFERIKRLRYLAKEMENFLSTGQ
jgi:hypothetical protein